MFGVALESDGDWWHERVHLTRVNTPDSDEAVIQRLVGKSVFSILKYCYFSEFHSFSLDVIYWCTEQASLDTALMVSR